MKFFESPAWLRIEFFASDLFHALWVLAPSPRAALKTWRDGRAVSAQVLDGMKQHGVDERGIE